MPGSDAPFSYLYNSCYYPLLHHALNEKWIWTNPSITSLHHSKFIPCHLHFAHFNPPIAFHSDTPQNKQTLMRIFRPESATLIPNIVLHHTPGQFYLPSASGDCPKFAFEFKVWCASSIPSQTRCLTLLPHSVRQIPEITTSALPGGKVFHSLAETMPDMRGKLPLGSPGRSPPHRFESGPARSSFSAGN